MEECGLLKASNQDWSADLCRTCPVPEILQANACEFLQLRASVGRPLTAGLQRRVQVAAYCQKSRANVHEPQVGCGECHPLPPMFEIRSK